MSIVSSPRMQLCYYGHGMSVVSSARMQLSYTQNGIISTSSSYCYQYYHKEKSLAE